MIKDKKSRTKQATVSGPKKSQDGFAVLEALAGKAPSVSDDSNAAGADQVNPTQPSVASLTTEIDRLRAELRDTARGLQEMELQKAQETDKISAWRNSSAEFERKSDALTQQVAVMREALIKLRDCDWVITPADRMDAVRDIARAALSLCPKPE